MNLLNFQLPRINPSVVWTIPSSLGQTAWNTLGGLKFQLPRIDADFFSRENSKKPLTAMANTLVVKDFEFNKSLTLSKLAPYAR